MQAPPTSPRKVLVIDDHAAMGLSLKLMLAPEHEVLTATSAEAALELLAGGGFDLVLCDVIMPGMNGLDLYARVRGQNLPLSDRFVFMTGGATSAAMATQLASSRLPVLEKPFAPEVLRALLRR